MDMTPIRIRGARSRRKRQVSEDQNSRPVKIRRRPTAITSRSKSLGDILKNASGRRLSSLERLPNELMQHIFTYSYNISLPLSSPYIARQLAHRWVYAGCAKSTLVVACDEPVNDNNSVDELGITALLSRSWMTWHFFRDIVNEAYANTRASNTEAHESQLPHPSSPAVQEGGRGTTMHSPQDPPTEAVASPNFDHPELQSHLSYLRLGPKVQIPEKLLKSPWTREKSQFLYYLCWLGLSVDWKTSTLGETASDGLTSAVAENNQLAVAALLCPTVGVVPSLTLLRSAVLAHGCDKTIVFHLLSAAVRSRITMRGQQSGVGMQTDVNFRDASLWSWASRVSSEKGGWLKNALRASADLCSARSDYDQDIMRELALSCGQAGDGVLQIPVPFR